jgi:hypothetical protein
VPQSLFYPSQLNDTQQEKIQKMYKPNATEKTPFNDLAIFFGNTLSDGEEDLQ